MLKRLSNLKKTIFFCLIFITSEIYSDSFLNNAYNNHGSVGLMNMPTARFFDEGVHGVTLFKGKPDQKITLTSNPYEWLEASFFYTNIENKPYCTLDFDFCRQDYKDKGFNIKLRVKEEGFFPAIAVGLNDFAGTGYYNSEYVVSSYGIGNIDLHFGIGWGQYNGSDRVLRNPLTYISDRFNFRDGSVADQGGQLNIGNYFSGSVSPFYGFSYKFKNKSKNKRK